MKKLKFRAWDTKRKVMRRGADNLLIGLDGCLFWNFAYECSVIGSHNKSEFVIMQYTGFKDIYGNEIYDGDIVRFNSVLGREKGMIEYKDGEFSVVDLEKRYAGRLSIYQKCYELEVIGNVYENPDLGTTSEAEK